MVALLPFVELSRPRPVPTNAVMSDYYFGLEFLKAYPGVYTTVFPWLSERFPETKRPSRDGFFFPERRDAPNRPRTFGARYTLMNDFAMISFSRVPSERACGQNTNLGCGTECTEAGEGGRFFSRRSFRVETPRLTEPRVLDSPLAQETTTAVNVLTRSKLVVKRIASKQTKEPRVPLTAELLVGEVTKRGAPRRFRHDFIFLFDSFFSGIVVAFLGPRARPAALHFFRRSRPRAPRRLARDDILSPESMRLLLN